MIGFVIALACYCIITPIGSLLLSIFKLLKSRATTFSGIFKSQRRPWSPGRLENPRSELFLVVR